MDVNCRSAFPPVVTFVVETSVVGAAPPPQGGRSASIRGARVPQVKQQVVGIPDGALRYLEIYVASQPPCVRRPVCLSAEGLALQHQGRQASSLEPPEEVGELLSPPFVEQA